MLTFRACYCVEIPSESCSNCAPNAGRIVLTGPEHAGLGDLALFDEALDYACRAGLDFVSLHNLRIGDVPSVDNRSTLGLLPIRSRRSA